MGRTHPPACVLGCAILFAAACSSGPGTTTSAGSGPRTKPLSIVAAENFWGSVVGQLAGRAAKVTSVVTDPSADPHSYESSSDDARAFADADLVVLNGAGYDTWAEKLISANPSSRRSVIAVGKMLGKKEGDNPHFWYDPDAVTRVADQVTANLKSIDPADAIYFNAQRAAFDTASQSYKTRLAAIKAEFAGTPVASTESIFVYLASYLGLKVISPPEFMQAVAEGNDPPATSVAAFQDLMAKKEAKVLVYNRQTATAVTTNIKKLATDNGIPLVGVTETIQPPDATYEDWFGAELLELQNALKAQPLTDVNSRP
jgi:zinc/manganese transport system substrate-binding protein